MSAMPCGRGVTGSSQGRPFFTRRMRRQPWRICWRPHEKRRRYEFEIPMLFSKSIFRSLILAGLVLSLLSTSCFRKKKYENPITKDTQQPDKVLFDKAIADSWYREAGSHGLAQAEAEYKDFILFYPNMEESAEAQEKVCMIHYKQMEKADRDPKHALRAEDECRLVLTQFPNSKFAPEAQQRLREIQEVLAQHEATAGFFYHHKNSFP